MSPPALPPLRYTLCFLTRGPSVLMLHRRRPPNQGRWNGVGGRIETGESARTACLREVREETGYALESVRFAGVLTWTGFEAPDGGLYLFTARAPAGEPGRCPEGELRWQPRAWVLSAPQVVSNIHYFGAEVLGGGHPRWHHCRYEDGVLAGYLPQALPPGLDPGAPASGSRPLW